MPLLSDPGGVSSQDFLTDDSAQVQPQPDIPDPPDFARIIPISALQDAKNQQQADDWAAQQRQDLADQWAALAHQQLDDMVSQWQSQSLPNDGMVNPPAGMTVQPILSETGQQSQAPDAGQTQTVEPTPVTSENFGQHLIDLLRQAVGHGANSAGLVDVTGNQQPSNPWEAFQNAVHANQNRNQPYIGPTGPGIYNPNVPQGGDLVEALTGGGREGAPESEAGVRMATGEGAGEAATHAEDAASRLGEAKAAVDRAVDAMRATEGTPEADQAYQSYLDAYKEYLRVHAGGAPAPGSPPKPPDMGSLGEAQIIPKEALTADHPIVQAAAEATPGNTVNGVTRPVNPDAVARLIQSPGFNPENLAKAGSRLSPTESAALLAYRAANDPEVANLLAKPTAPEGAAAGAEDIDARLQAIRDRLGAASDALQEPPATEPGTGPDLLQEPNPFDEPSRLTGPPPPETPSSAEPDIANLANAGRDTGQNVTPEQAHSAWDTISKVGTGLKQAVVAGGIFHPAVESLNLGATGLATGRPMQGARGVLNAFHAFVSSKFGAAFAAENADAIEEARAAGGHLLDIGSSAPDLVKSGNRIGGALFGGAGGFAAGYVGAKQKGATNDEALGAGAGGALAGAALVGGLAPTFNEHLWGEFVPVAKVEAYKLLRAAGYDPEVAASRINDTFGGQGLGRLADAPGLEKLARVTFLAPDWLLSAAKNAGAVIKPGPEGQAARRFWAARLGAAFVATEGISMALNGHPSWIGPDGKEDLRHATKVDVSRLFGQKPGTLYADFGLLGPVGSAATGLIRGDKPEDTVLQHLNVIPRIAYDAYTNQQYPGGPAIVKKGTPALQSFLPEAANAAEQLAPITISTTSRNLPAGITQALSGIPISATAPAAPKGGKATIPGVPRGLGISTGYPGLGKAPSQGTSILHPSAQQVQRNRAAAGIAAGYPGLGR